MQPFRTVNPPGTDDHRSQAPSVELHQISKHFPGVVANDRVDFDLRPGEIHALLGENGAGKTTLMQIFCGLYPPDSGEIRMDGRVVQFHSPADAIAAGIGMVYQHFMLVESFTVADNIILGQPSSSWWQENRQTLYPRLQALGDRYGLQVNPAAEVWQLSVGEQQRVEILKAIYRGARILILDEPTAVLTPQEVEELLQILRRLADQGTSIIFISHKLNEVLAVCDRITVLRDGHKVGTVLASDCSEADLAQMMVGREVTFTQEQRLLQPGHPLLQLTNLWVEGDRGLAALLGIDLTVRAGEIVGIAGVDGNGQRELEEAIAGLRPTKSGVIQRTAPLAHIPSDRYTLGLLSDFSVAENMVLRDVEQPPFSKRGFLNPQAIYQFARQLIQAFQIRTPSPQTLAGKLSGGNAQRIVLARELTRSSEAGQRVILAAQPTRGLDISAIEDVHAQLLAQRQAGAAILLISTELEEVLRLSDRIAVLYEGQITGILTAPDFDSDLLGLMMAGRFQDG